MKLFLVLAVCVAVALAQDEKADDSLVLIGCNEENDEICTAANSGHVCNVLLGNGLLVGADRFKGACVPKACDADKKCPNVGKPLSGVLYGHCNDDGTCEYSKAVAQA